jgi:hypothetical protein
MEREGIENVSESCNSQEEDYGNLCIAMLLALMHACFSPFPLYLVMTQTPRSSPLHLPPLSFSMILFLNTLNTLPLPSQILLPQANLIIPLTDRQHIPAQTPTHSPQYALEPQLLTLPRPATHTRPDPHRLILRRARDVRFL